MLVVSTVPATIQAFLLPHIRALQEAGCEVMLAAGGEPTPSMHESGATFFRVPLSRRAWALWKHASACRALRSLIRCAEVDVVYVHTPVASAVARVAASSLPPRRRPAVVYFAHGFHFMGPRERDASQWLWYALERALSRWTSQLIVINDVDAESVKRWSIAKRGDVRLVRGVGFDPTLLAPDGTRAPARRRILSSADIGEPPDAPVVLCLAEFTKNKRQRLLVEAVATLPRVRLVFAGDGPMRPSVERLVTALGLEDRVEFLGHVDNVAGLFESSDVCALVSRREGLPRSLMESLSAGVPIVVTATRGSMDLARIAGCTVAREDSPAAVADAIQVALRDSRTRERIRAEFIEGFADGLEQRVNQDVLSAIAAALPSRDR